MRQIRPTDRFVVIIDQALRSIVPGTSPALRESPGKAFNNPKLTIQEARHVAGLMRINHTGEVCAQALYNGQAFTAKLPHVQQEMERSGLEEQDHLAWCEYRLRELGSHTSLLNPLWYGLSFGIGALAGAISDEFSLGFVAETEKQVSKHLISHMAQLPKHDTKSHAILNQMNIDELDHRDKAIKAGGIELPLPIRGLMTLLSKIMTKTTYYI